VSLLRRQISAICSKRALFPYNDSLGLGLGLAAFCPDNTKVNTRWAVKNFSDWQIEYNNCHAENPCPEGPGVLLVDDASVLASWLPQKYVLAGDTGSHRRLTIRKHQL